LADCSASALGALKVVEATIGFLSGIGGVVSTIVVFAAAAILDFEVTDATIGFLSGSGGAVSTIVVFAA
jgi:uncharacterized membrane protein